MLFIVEVGTFDVDERGHLITTIFGGGPGSSRDLFLLKFPRRFSGRGNIFISPQPV